MEFVCHYSKSYTIVQLANIRGIMSELKNFKRRSAITMAFVLPGVAIAGFGGGTSNNLLTLIGTTVVVLAIALFLRMSAAQWPAEITKQILAEGTTPEGFTVEAKLLNNGIRAIFGGASGKLTITPSTVSFATSKGETIFNEPVTAIRYENHTSPPTYFSIRTASYEYKLSLVAPTPGPLMHNYSWDIGDHIVKLLNGYISSGKTESDQ